MKKFAIIGGDIRQLYIGEALKNDGFDVCCFGFDNTSLPRVSSLYEAVQYADICILPLPVTKDGTSLNAPNFAGIIPIEDVFCANKIFIGGLVCSKIYELCPNILDYYKNEQVEVAGAIPTAEGAIMYAMENMAVTLNGANALVIGYGRIGKILAQYLYALGTKVTIASRRDEHLEYARAFGYNGIYNSQIAQKVNTFDVIFNTAPALVVDREIIEKIHIDALIIDLASPPGGVDFMSAQSKNIKTLWLLSLPGKVAPKTAGLIIKQSVMKILSDLEVNKK